MSLLQSKSTVADFFNDKKETFYSPFSTNSDAIFVFDWLKHRINLLIGSISIDDPALQGVIYDLEEDILIGKLSWTVQSKDDKFIRMIGAMTGFLVEEFGYHSTQNIDLRNSRIIQTASKFSK